MVSLFERLDKGRPPSAAEEKIQPPRNELEPAQRLLDFLQRWAKDTVSLRDILVFGPYSLRDDRKSAIDAAETLAAHGWLVPQKAHRHDRREWQVLRKPIIRPTVAGMRR